MKKNTLKGMSFSSLRAKLLSTVAMLLVASTLLVTSSYAWFVMSTAPEVTGIDTQVGANGALEIALLNQESWDNLSKLDMGDIDESATGDTAAAALAANLTWGNLVNLADPSYGLSKIILQPARLNITDGGVSGEQQSFKINQSLLKTPIYGEDGRVKGLDTNKTANYVLDANKSGFGTPGYGVRAIGTSAQMSVFQMGMNSARVQLSTATAAAIAEASRALKDNGAGIANIVLKKAMGTGDSFTGKEVEPLLSMAQMLQGSLEQLDNALRAVFAGYITTADSGIATEEAYQAALENINNKGTTLRMLFTTHGGIVNMVHEMESYIAKLEKDQTDVADAITKCQKLITANSATWQDIYEAMEPLVNYDKIMLGNRTMSDIEKDLNSYIEKNPGTSKKDAAVKLLMPDVLAAGGVKLKVPSGSGIVSDVADFAGDYTVKVTVKFGDDAPVDQLKGMSLDATMQTAGVVPPYLTVCSGAMSKATLKEATGSVAITDFYGYALDLAFRTNAAASGKETSGLLLQTEPRNRVYEGSEENKALQGGGSYMEFTTQAGLSATKMVKLMDGIRVVFMNGENNTVLALAKLDMQLAKNNYTKLPDSERTTDKFAYLNGFGDSYQVSDVIKETDYNGLQEENGSVVFDAANKKVTAKLYLYDFSRTKSSTSTETETETKYTGGITIEDKREKAVITELTPDVVQKVTAIVYLDGSVVTNATVAANAAQSMAGKLNLQFSSDATLMPADNTALKQGKAAGN